MTSTPAWLRSACLAALPALALAGCVAAPPDRDMTFQASENQFRMRAMHMFHDGPGGERPMVSRSIVVEVAEDREGRPTWRPMMTDEYGYFLMPIRFKGKPVRLIEPSDRGSYSAQRVGVEADYRKQYRTRMASCAGPVETAGDDVVLDYPCKL